MKIFFPFTGFILILLYNPVWASEGLLLGKGADKERTSLFKGYIKYLQTTVFPGNANEVLTDNFFHHRLNFRWDAIESLRFAVEVRNRIHWGETVKLANTFGQGFSEMIDNNDICDMSVVLLDRQTIVWHAMLDRAYLRFLIKRFEAAAGRQRINWGITLIWNPNDIFNAYSFYDFDYEERPGSDAVRLIFYPNSKSSLEVAGKLARKKEQMVSAVLYKWNKARYDFQAFAGAAGEDIVAGGGWAGNIKNAGFKGEFTYFRPYNHILDSAGVFTGTISGEYSFKKKLYLHGSFLYTSNGSNHADFFHFASRDFTAKTLSPYKYNFLIQLLYPFTPIFTGSLAMLYSPGEDHATFLNPVLTYNIKENWDVDVVSQIFLSGSAGRYEDIAELFFLRLRWSY